MKSARRPDGLATMASSGSGWWKPCRLTTIMMGRRDYRETPLAVAFYHLADDDTVACRPSVRGQQDCRCGRPREPSRACESTDCWTDCSESIERLRAVAADCSLLRGLR